MRKILIDEHIDKLLEELAAEIVTTKEKVVVKAVKNLAKARLLENANKA